MTGLGPSSGRPRLDLLKAILAKIDPPPAPTIDWELRIPSAAS
jgi:hypothetical protein